MGSSCDFHLVYISWVASKVKPYITFWYGFTVLTCTYTCCWYGSSDIRLGYIHDAKTCRSYIRVLECKTNYFRRLIWLLDVTLLNQVQEAGRRASLTDSAWLLSFSKRLSISCNFLFCTNGPPVHKPWINSVYGYQIRIWLNIQYIEVNKWKNISAITIRPLPFKRGPLLLPILYAPIFDVHSQSANINQRELLTSQPVENIWFNGYDQEPITEEHPSTIGVCDNCPPLKEVINSP